MSLSIPALSSPFASALTYEAGCFCGVESHISRKGSPQRSGGPFATLSSVFNIMTITVELVTQTGLLLTTIAAASNESHFTWSNLLLILLSLSPSGIRLIGSFLFGDFRRGRRTGIQRLRLEEREVRQIGTRGEFKQEVALFGLKDWVLDKWDRLKKQQLQEQDDVKTWQETVELGLGLSTQSVETAFYVSPTGRHAYPYSFRRSCSLSAFSPLRSLSVPSGCIKVLQVLFSTRCIDFATLSSKLSNQFSTSLLSARPLPTPKLSSLPTGRR